MTVDIIIKNGYVVNREAVVDIAIDDGRIQTVADTIDTACEREINADGRLTAPGFIDAHLHLDKACGAYGDRVPRGHQDPFTFESIAEHEREHFTTATTEEITENALRNIQHAVGAGSTILRTHVNVDRPYLGLQNLRATVSARDRASELADIQVTPMGGGTAILEEETESRLRTAIALAREDAGSDEDVLVGGYDPPETHTRFDEIARRWFEIATDLDTDIDVHIQNGGTLGVSALERLVEMGNEHRFNGRTTVSHGFALAHAPGWKQEELIEQLGGRSRGVVVCYQTVRSGMPLRKMLDKNVCIGHGTDNFRDFVFPHGNADQLEGILTLANKLQGDRPFAEVYRWFETTEGLRALWDVLTHRGAELLGVSDYGIAEGNRGDLVVLDAPSPEWAIATDANRSFVIKNGVLVATDGTILPEHRVAPPRGVTETYTQADSP